MNYYVRIIRHSDHAWHDRFFDFEASVFRAGGRTFPIWGARGGWVAGYDVFAAIVDNQIVSTVGRSAMRFVINGEERSGYQLGAVATPLGHRNRGLARLLMNKVLGELDAPDQPVILFANPTVLDFYPRFGFRRLSQARFVGHVDVRPSGTFAPSLDLARPIDRAWLADHCASAVAIGQHFAAQDYYPAMLFNLTHRPRTIIRLDLFGAVVIVQQDGNRLLIRPATDTALQVEGCLTLCLRKTSTDARIWFPSASLVAKRREPSLGRWGLAAFYARRGCGRRGAHPVSQPGTNVSERSSSG
jgi:predicted N-acetyltransferase YhbS